MANRKMKKMLKESKNVAKSKNAENVEKCCKILKTFKNVGKFKTCWCIQKSCKMLKKSNLKKKFGGIDEKLLKKSTIFIRIIFKQFREKC